MFKWIKKKVQCWLFKRAVKRVSKRFEPIIIKEIVFMIEEDKKKAKKNEKRNKNK